MAEAPGRSYNPLFLYGGVGLGKTHLMHAIGQYVDRHHRQAALTYISSERFMNEMINAIRYERIIDFRERYRNVDVLLVDDAQFLAGKEATQNEFFHTFNALYDAGKQIVLSSDRPPHEIPALEERLRSRFNWGLIADIQPPDLETKVAILKKKADADGVPLPDNVALFIATKIKSNIRDLEGSLIRLVAYASLTGKDITLALAQDVLRNIIGSEEKAITLDALLKFVAEYYGVRPSELKAASNSRNGRHPPPGGDVPVQGADVGVPARHRSGVRQAPLDGHPLHPQGRGGPEEGRGFQQPDQRHARQFPLGRTAADGVLHSRTLRPCATGCGRAGTGLAPTG